MNTKYNKGKFKKGTSGNPAGRPLGSRNKATLAYQELMHNAGPRLVQTVVDQALKGDGPSQRLCFERIYPAHKQAPIEFSLQPIESIADLPRAFQEVATAMSEGRITPDQLASITNFLNIQKETLKDVDIERRVREIEKAASEVNKYQAELHRFVANDVESRKAESAEKAASDGEEESKR